MFGIVNNIGIQNKSKDFKVQHIHRQQQKNSNIIPQTKHLKHKTGSRSRTKLCYHI